MRVDHLILGAARLEDGIAFFEERSGARAAPGGRHERWGTWNALVALGGDRYLEIMAPDPAVSSPPEPRPFGIESLTVPRLVTWVASGKQLEFHRERALRAGIDLGAISEGSRQRTDGTVLRWRMTDLAAPREGGVLPFLMDWLDSPHPSASLPRCCTLLGLEAEHPESRRVAEALDALGLHLAVAPGETPTLVATLETPRGIVQLR